jgi:predicted nuclease with TOPRIM domain
MSWLSGSLGSVTHGLSSITGQISSFTKEVLKEGTEEVNDHQTELRIANGKVKELESAAEGQKQEWDRIRRENSELREQVEAAELQISSISKQYRELLQTKEVRDHKACCNS